MRLLTPLASVARWGPPLLALGLAVAVCAPCHAQDDAPEPEAAAPTTTWQIAVRDATDAYVEADYARVVTLLAPFASDESIPGDRRIRLLRLLSLAYVLQAPPDPGKARTVMESLVAVDPDFRYLEGLAPPEAIALLDDVRSSLNLPTDGDGTDPVSGPETIYVQRSVRERVRWAAFVPFGVGHFQNDWDSLGYTFASLEALSLLTNIGTFLAVEGLRGPTGFYTREDRRIAGEFQTAQIVSIVALGAFIVVDIVIANVLFVPEDVDVRTLDGPPPELSFEPALPSPAQTPSVTGFFQFRSSF